MWLNTWKGGMSRWFLNRDTFTRLSKSRTQIHTRRRGFHYLGFPKWRDHVAQLTVIIYHLYGQV